MLRTCSSTRARLGRASVVFFTLLAAPLPSGAQPPSLAASSVPVTGVVTDGSGAVVPDAVVTAVVAGRASHVAATAADGRYALNVPARVPFAIRVRRDGFADAVVEMSGAAGPVARDVVLSLGGVSDTLVVTPSRGAEGRATVTHAVSVVTAEDLDAIGAASLADALRHVPGLSVEANGREGALTALFSRGGESDYNLVLIDGVRVNQNGGRFDFSRVAAGEIERVEVVRGAQSSLWGSDAMGAVVQIFTRGAGPAGGTRVSGSVSGGSLDTWRGETHVGGASGRVDYHAGVTHRRTRGAFSDALREPDRFEQTTADGRVGVSLGPRASVRSGLRHSNALGRSVGQVASGPGNSGGRYDTRELSWHAEVAHSAGRRFSGAATAALYRFDSESADRFGDPSYTLYAILEGTPGALFPAGPRVVRYLDATEFAALSSDSAALGPRQFLVFTPFGVSDFPFVSRTVFRRPSVRYEGEYAWAGGQRLIAGYEYERESTPLDGAVTLHNNAVFVQQQLSAGDRWFVTIGGRVDHKSSYDTFFSPKLSAGGFLRPYAPGAVSSVKVFGNIGRGIKTPNFLERFGASFADPNPGLVVERARTADAGVEMTFADGRVRGVATWFDNDVRDQVEYVPSSFSLDGIPDYVNIAGAVARGVEIEAALLRPAAGLTVSGSYWFVDSEVRDTAQIGSQFLPGQPLIRRPRHSAVLRARYGAGPVGLHGDVRGVGARHDALFFFDGFAVVPNDGFPAAPFTDVTVNPGYVVVGLGADLRMRDGVTLFLRADNVADERYDGALGYPGLPRTFVAGVRFRVR